MLGITRRKENATPEADLPPAPAPIDVYENDREFLVFADLPGVPRDGADVTLEAERLVVQAKAPTRKFRRELLVPPSVDAEHVSAEMKAGVLTLRLPKRAPYQPRTIQVRAT